MSNTNTGGPAFPTLNEHQAGPALWQYSGMTLRDYFAAKVMQGMMVDVDQPIFGYIAQTSYEMADAMLKAREQ